MVPQRKARGQRHVSHAAFQSCRLSSPADAKLTFADSPYAELGEAVKTIFPCQYLHSAALRREIHEGLNIIEQWNGANDFVFFAKRGELASNRREDQEISMLCLHLQQNCMVYINTLMLQQVLSRPHWQDRLTVVDRHNPAFVDG